MHKHTHTLTHMQLYLSLSAAAAAPHTIKVKSGRQERKSLERLVHYTCHQEGVATSRRVDVIA